MPSLGTLRWVLGLAALVHLTGLVLTLYSIYSRKDVFVPLCRGFASWPKPTLGAGFVQPDVIASGGIYLKLLIASFFALSFIFSIVPASIAWPIYLDGVRRGIRPFKYIEYSFSAAVLTWIVAALNGIQDLHLMILIFAATTTTMFCGLIQEEWAVLMIGLDKQVLWIEFFLPFITGCIPFGTIWYIFFDKFELALQHQPAGEHIPASVVGFVVAEFLLFSSFAINQFVEMIRTRFATAKARQNITIQHELATHVLSVTAKAVAGGTLLTGVLARGSSGGYSNNACAAFGTLVQ